MVIKTGNTRFFAFLLLLWIGMPSATFSQGEPYYSVAFENQTLKSILAGISAQTGFKFAYSETQIDVTETASFSITEMPFDSVLNILSSRFHLDTETLGSTVILKPKANPEYFYIRGSVFDAKYNNPIQWVNVTSIDGQQGAITDSSGFFSMKIPSRENSIRFSFMGYKSQVLAIKANADLHIIMEEELIPIDELVVVAFGQENRNLIGGAVSVFNPGVFEQLNNESLNSSLQSTIPGLLVQNNAGTPGSAINVTIRGINSITAGNSPLYIVDGIPVIRGNYSQLDFSGQTLDAITDISLYDIESISVLKDAASSSLYGVSSSNGVILINTKRGRENQQQVQLESYYGLQATTGQLSMLNATQWMNLSNEKAIAAGNSAVYSEADIRNNTINTNWLDKVFRVAPVASTYISFRGGNTKSKYYVSANYFDQQGIIIGSDYQRYSFRINYDYKLTDRLSFEYGNGFSYSRNNRIEGDQSLNGPLPVGISMPPVYPVYNPDGSYNNDGPYANPVSIANEEKNLASTFRNLFSLALNYKLTEELQIRSQTGVDFYNLGEETFAPKEARQGSKYNGLGIEATNNTFLINNSTYFNYHHSYGVHEISFLGGFSLDRYRKHGTYLRAQNFPGSSFEFLQNGATPIIASSDETDAASNSLFTSMKYSNSKKYIFTFNLRRDGSSRFGANNRFGYFPSVSGLWYISKEEFWQTNPVLTKLKIKASYGQTGNDQIENFLSLDLFAAGSNYNGQAGISPYQLSNPDLKWETTNQFNVGIDVDVFNNFNISAEYYHKKTKDLLLENPIPPSTGFEYFLSNIGTIQNQGLEFMLSSAFSSGGFHWDGNFSFTANRNKVLKLYNDQPVRNIGRAGSSIEVGEPVSFFYGFLSRGVNPDNGLLIYEDVYKDGKINDLDRTKIGTPFPMFYGALASNFSYKSIGLNFLFFYSYGNDIFNSTRLYTETLSIGNQTTAVLNRWMEPGDKTSVPKASSYNERISSRFIEDGSFIRLKSIKLSYSMKNSFTEKLGFSFFETYLAGKNLLTLTRYSGMDPEVNYNPSNPIVLGTDFFTCPQPKSLIFGVCAKF